MGRRKKTVEVVEPVKEEVVQAPVETVVEEPVKEPVKEDIKVEEVKDKNEEMLNIPEMPETVKEGKKEYDVKEVIRKFIGSETARIFDGTLSFKTLNDFVDNRCNVVLGDLDIRKFTVNIPPLPKVIFGNLIVNKDATYSLPAFLGGKVIKK